MNYHPMRHNIPGIRFLRLFSFAAVVIFCMAVAVSPLYPDTKKEKPGDVKKEEVREKGDAGKKADAEKTGDALDDESKTGLPTKEYTDEDFKPKVEEESYAWMIIRTIIILGLLIGGFYYFFRFVTKKTGMQLRGEEVVNILSIVPIGQNKYLQVVDLAGKLLVLGITDNNISLISEITEKDEIDRIRILSSRVPTGGEGGFQDYLTKQIGRVIERFQTGKNRGRMSFHDSGVDMDFLKQQRSRLKNLNGVDDE